MKLSKIALATSLALGVMSAHAASTGIPTTPTNIVFIAGATGVDGYMGAAASSLINITASVTSPNSKAWYGTTKAAMNGLAAGSNLLIIKRSAGGSAIGVIPLGTSSKTNVPQWDVGTLVSGTNYSVADTTDANGLIPDIGVSDVEPKMFTGINTENGFTPLTATQQATLTVNSWGQLAEGIVATKSVDDTTVLSNNFMREALSGHYVDWTAAVKADGTNAGYTNPMVICRRIEGSGTQAAFNSYFNGFPNTAAYSGFAYNTPAVTTDSYGYNAAGSLSGVDSTHPIVIDPSAGFTVFEADGSGDVRKCLQAAQLGLDVTLKGRAGLYYTLKFSAVGGASKAIGVLSLDSYTKVGGTTVDGTGVATSNTAATGQYTFRNLNGNGTYDVKNQAVTTAGTSTGIAPSRANILNSYYDFTVEPTMQYRTSGTKSYIIGTTGLFAKLLTVLGNPVDMLVGSTNNSSPLAYAALPALYTKTANGAATDNVADLTRQGNTTAPLHVNQ